MKKIKFTKHFEKSFKKRIAPHSNLSRKFASRLKIFQENPHHSMLRNHALIGAKVGKKAFSIGEDLRIVYSEDEDFFIFYDVGSHNQVY